jgi:hypothetical protein
MTMPPSEVLTLPPSSGAYGKVDINGNGDDCNICGGLLS